MSEPLDDPELWEVFREEMTRHVRAVAGPRGDAAAWRAALHAMRGASAMMGLDELAAELSGLDEGLRARDSDVVRRGLRALERRLVDLGVDAQGMGALDPPADARSSARPTPPAPALNPAERAELYGYFLSDARSRLESLRELFSAAELAERREDARRAMDDALRVLHALKGASAMAGAQGVARAAHALEGAVQSLAARTGGAARRDYEALELARAQLAMAPGTADEGDAVANVMIEGLRAAGLLRARDVPAAMSSRAAPRSVGEDLRGDEHVRVAARTVAQLAEALGEVSFVRDRVDQGADSVADVARGLGHGAKALEDALRRIGPARPWGVPAEVIASVRRVGDSLRDASSRLEGGAARARRQSDALGRAGDRAQELLRGAGQVTAAWIFDRVAPVAQLHLRGDRQVRVLRDGDETPVDRAVAEPLVDVLSQLVRNAVAHGLERPAVRVARAKPAAAALRLEARAEGDAVRFAVEDDGEGVDLDAVRARAELLGHLRGDGPWSDVEVLETLFIPGVSTRAWAAPDAGRGVGLDLVRESVRRLGGGVCARTRRGQGTRFEVTVETRSVAQRLLPVLLPRRTVMIPLARVGGIEHASRAPGAMSLARLLGDATDGQGLEPVALRLRGGEVERWVTAPTVGTPLALVVRALPPALEVGPWRGAAIDGAGRVALVLDPERLPR